MYVAVKGGERAIENAHRLLAHERRGDPAPAQTWGQDVGKVLASAHDATSARRLQSALKSLLRK